MQLPLIIYEKLLLNVVWFGRVYSSVLLYSQRYSRCLFSYFFLFISEFVCESFIQSTMALKSLINYFPYVFFNFFFYIYFQLFFFSNEKDYVIILLLRATEFTTAKEADILWNQFYPVCQISFSMFKRYYYNLVVDCIGTITQIFQFLHYGGGKYKGYYSVVKCTGNIKKKFLNQLLGSIRWWKIHESLLKWQNIK